jgi:hypothetical protein
LNRLLALARLGAINLGVMVILLLLAEGALRVGGVARPAFYRYDPIRGFSHRPGARGWWTQEGRGWVSINRAGFRDGDHSAQPITGVLRGAVLGDSFSEAFQVNQNQTWWQQLQNQVNGRLPCPLTAAYPKGLELLNFGVGAYGTGQELLTWQTNGRQSRPQLVLLAMYLDNDIDDNTPKARDDRPVFRLDPSGKLQLDNSFRQAPASRFRQSWPGRSLDWLVEHSRLAQLLNAAKNRAANPAVPQLRPDIRKEGLPPGPPPAAPASPSGWALTAALIKRLNQEVQASGAQLIVISLTSPEQLWPNRRQRPAKPFAREQQLEALLQPLGITYFPLAPTLQQQADAQGLSLHGFPGQQPGLGHWNANGHRLAAAELARRLCAQPLGSP